MRKSYEESCRLLQGRGHLDPGPLPPLPERAPRQDDDEPFGVSFFRTHVEGDLSGLTLPRTFAARSELSSATFADTDLSESTMCWNDFTDVDFSGADLRGADLRASFFDGVTFERADLRGADLRHSAFLDCEFDGARMDGTRLTVAQGELLELSDEQRDSIVWAEDDGEEPPGG